MTSKFVCALVGLALSSAAAAADYCAMPYLYATNIRPACEQYGSLGLESLYSSNLFITGMLDTQGKIAARVR